MNTNPARLHVLLNHLPLTGLAVALMILVVSMVLRSRPAAVLALASVALLAGSVWPVIESGEDSYVRVRELADDYGKVQLKQHMLMAERWSSLYYITAAASVAALLAAWKWPRALYPLAILAAALAAASLLAGAIIADAGGKVRHPEFRTGPPPPNVPLEPEHHHAH